MHVDRGADVYRVLRHLDAVGRGRESAAEHFAGDGAEVRSDRGAFGGGGVRGAAGVAGFTGFSGCEYRVFVCGGKNVGAALYGGESDAAAGEFRVRAGSADWGGAAALLGGTQQRAAEIVFWRGRREESRAAQ